MYICALRAGRIVETFSCPTDGMLKIASITAVDGQEQHCIQVGKPCGIHSLYLPYEALLALVTIVAVLLSSSSGSLA